MWLIICILHSLIKMYISCVHNTLENVWNTSAVTSTHSSQLCLCLDSCHSLYFSENLVFVVKWKLQNLCFAPFLSSLSPVLSLFLTLIENTELFNQWWAIQPAEHCRNFIVAIFMDIMNLIDEICMMLVPTEL